jgi:hypothetical protein
MVKKAVNTTSEVGHQGRLDKVVNKAKSLLKQMMELAGVPESHGFGHALAVHGHLVRALQSNKT